MTFPQTRQCKKKGNLCLLNEGKLCLGPITAGGCNALCPTNNVTCYGCRGPTKDANIKAFINLLKEKGYNEKVIHDKIQIFAGLQFKEALEKKGASWLNE